MTDLSDVEKLKILIPHWIEHNAEHSREYREWAHVAGDSGAHLDLAADLLDQAGQALDDCLEEISTKTGGRPT